MATEAQILQQINDNIVANGNNAITADVLRPILQEILAFIPQEMGVLTDLETEDQSNAVAAINELTNLLQNPGGSTNPLVEIVEVASNYTPINSLNRAIHQVSNQNNNPVTITIPAAVTGPTLSINDPQIGSFYDFYQLEAANVPVFVLEPGVAVYVEDGDSLKFTGVNSGVRLIKVAPNVWRFIRITKNGGAFREAVTGSIVTDLAGDKFTNGKVGINEQNPDHNLDIKGDQKTTWVAEDERVVSSHVGDAAFSDLGIPDGAIKGAIMTASKHPDYLNGHVYMFSGDVGAFKFINLMSVKDVLTPGSSSEARILTYALNSNTLEKFAQVRAINTAGDNAGLTAVNGADVEDPYTWYYAIKAGIFSNMYHTPYGFEIRQGRLHLKDYEAPYKFVEGYDHGDGLVAGAPTKGLAVDAAGLVQTINTYIEKTVVLSSADVINLDGIDKEIVPAPGANKVIVLDKLIYIVEPGATAFGNDTTIFIKIGTSYVGEANVVLTTTTKKVFMCNLYDGQGNTEIPINQALSLEAESDPASGNGTLKVIASYKILDI